MMIGARADVNSADTSGKTPLIHHAMGYKYVPKEIVIISGSSLVRTKDETAVKAHLLEQQLKVLQVLLETGANPEAKDNEGKMALDHANCEQARALLRKAQISAVPEFPTKKARTLASSAVGVPETRIRIEGLPIDREPEFMKKD